MDKAETNIRPADASEMDAVRALTRRAYQPWVAKLGREPMPMTADYDAAYLNHRFDVIGEMGSLRAVLQTQIREDSLWIENIAAAPEHHGQGLGGRLLDHAEYLAREAAKSRLTLYTNKLMAKNIAIYKGRSFVIDKEVVMDHGVVVWMSKGV